ncbi:MAG TPA: two-component regulator propeller domain-containing protein [Saprospiraceae bacterium]|nr:two-component regulator propeller domain-containing protein [Saprospiraceae bacterium]
MNITSTLYTQENGLASNMLVGIGKDSIGYRYFQPINGKWMRYDGVNFDPSQDYHANFDEYKYLEGTGKNVKLQFINNSPSSVQENIDGSIYRWSVKGDSLHWVDVRTDKKENFLLPEEFISPYDLAYFPNGDFCWITTPDKITRFDLHTKKFDSISIPSKIHLPSSGQPPLNILRQPGGLSFLVVSNMVLKNEAGSSSFRLFCTYASISEISKITEIIQDSFLFISAINAMFYEVNLIDGNVTSYKMTDFIHGMNLSALDIITIRNYNNYLLIATANAGLCIFNRCTKSMQHFLYEKQNASTDLTNSIIWLAVDDENVIWMQTEAGLIKLEINNQLFSTYKPSTFTPDGLCNDCNNIRAIYSLDAENLLVGTLHGLFTFNSATGKFGNLLSPVDNQPVQNNRAVSAIIGDKKGNIFIADWGNTGIIMYNESKKKLVTILQQDDHPDFKFTVIRCLYYDTHDVLWIGTSEGFLRITNLVEFENNSFTGNLNVTHALPGASGYDPDHVMPCFTITEDANERIWIGTADGLYVYHYRDNSFETFHHDPDNGNPISHDEIRSIWVSSADEIWLGTNNGGLNHFDVSAKTFKAYTLGDGLPNNSIYTILEDHNGFLWLGTNAGLCRFNITDHSVRNYTPRDGIQNFEFNTNAVNVMPDGRFCFGGRTGFNIFHPDEMPTHSSVPKVVITRFRVFDKETPFKEAVLHFPFDANSFTFDFSTLSFYRNNDNQFAYMMEGSDKDWINAGSKSTTSYGNLPPGKYTFKVRAANYTGTWNKEMASISILIHPAWYNTLWFRSIIALMIAGGIYLLYRYRMSQVMKLQVVRNRIASDLHDEIGSTLSSISLSSTLIQRKLNGSHTEAHKLLQQVSTNTDTMMEALSDIVWAINTRNDRFDNVVNRMRAFAIELLEPVDINIEFNVDEGMKDVHLDMQHRKNLYLIFKEAMHNIVKYAVCKNVLIEIRRAGKIIDMNITDDGCGFELAEIQDAEKGMSGNGILNMKKRAVEMGGQMKIQSERDKGTTIHLRFSV